MAGLKRGPLDALDSADTLLHAFQPGCGRAHIRLALDQSRRNNGNKLVQSVLFVSTSSLWGHMGTKVTLESIPANVFGSTMVEETSVASKGETP